jgi:hypothetical protein
MANLAGDKLYVRRGNEPPNNEFGYAIAAGEKVYRGSLVGLNAAGNVQRVSTAGTVVFLGLADRQVDNSASAAVGSTIVPMKGTWSVPVPSATPSNIGAPVYCAGTDDQTLTLTQTGSLLAAGVLAGIENGVTFISIIGG